LELKWVHGIILQISQILLNAYRDEELNLQNFQTSKGNQIEGKDDISVDLVQLRDNRIDDIFEVDFG